MTPILAIGSHIFEIFPLSLQKIDERTRASWPVINRFGRGGARQFVGLGEDEFEVSGLYFDEEFGGHADYMALKATQKLGKPVDLLGWGEAASYASVFGAVVILEVGVCHTFISKSGIGRKAEFSVKLGSFGDGAGGGLFG